MTPRPPRVLHPSDKPPTARQIEVLRLIAARIKSLGAPPTLRELAVALGMGSTNAVSDHLRPLARKGLIEWTPMMSRGIRVLPAAAPFLVQDRDARVREIDAQMEQLARERQILLAAR